MDLKLEKAGDVVVVRPRGNLDIQNSTDFKNTVKSTVSDGNIKIVIDLAYVNFIDSSGLGSLVACLRSTNQEGGSVKLAGLTSEVRIVIELTRLHHVFSIFHTVEDAVASFA